MLDFTAFTFIFAVILSCISVLNCEKNSRDQLRLVPHFYKVVSNLPTTTKAELDFKTGRMYFHFYPNIVACCSMFSLSVIKTHILLAKKK